MFFCLRVENISHIVSAVDTKEEAISTKGETEEWRCYKFFKARLFNFPMNSPPVPFEECKNI